MTNKLNLPASYAVMNEEEMTYTQGGSALGAAATVVGAVVLGSSYLWGIGQAKDWLSVKKNREGNFLTVAGRASDAIAADMAKSPANFLRDAVSTAMVVSLAPLSAILMIFCSPIPCPYGTHDAFLHRLAFAFKGVLLWRPR